MSRIPVIGENEDLTSRLNMGKFVTTRRKWSDVKRKSDSLANADVVIADLTVPNAYTVRGLADMQKAHPNISLVLRTDADLSHSAAMLRLLDSFKVDFVRSSANADEIRLRIHRLLKQRNAADTQAIGFSKRHLVTELHHPDNGRLDARRIADFFGIPLADTAKALGVSLSRLHKTPAAPSAQVGLLIFERIATALLTLVGSKEAARVWLRLPDNHFSGKTPLAVILESRGNLVADMLDDMMVGQPS